MFRIDYSHVAEQYLDSLPMTDRRRILGRIEQARENPTHFFIRLHGSRFWRLRAGDHRIIADILIVNQKIFVLRIGNRKNVYD